jgi:hypothetical protein
MDGGFSGEKPKATHFQWGMSGSFHHATDEPERSAAVVMAFPPRALQGSQVRIFWRERPADGNARCAVFREDFGKSSQAALPRSYIGRLSGATPVNRR